jgi:predicted SAM-dependent methyltransferase
VTILDRKGIILKGITRHQHGIEIAPWFAPLAPKGDGYNCLVLDLLDDEALRSRAAADENVNPEQIREIETVDLVGNAIDIAELVDERGEIGTFDYVLSSHNFEHLPDPIRFLQGCHKVLKAGGIVSMAIPDHRACFDYFRPATRIYEWLQAYFEGRRCPTAEQVFAFEASIAKLKRGDKYVTAFSVADDPRNIELMGDLQSNYDRYREFKTKPSGVYLDSHCSVMSPHSLELLITEGRQLGLLPFRVSEVTEPIGCEFCVQLQAIPVEEYVALPPELFSRERNRLVHEIAAEDAALFNQRTARYPFAASSLMTIFDRTKSFAVRLWEDPRPALVGAINRIQQLARR